MRLIIVTTSVILLGLLVYKVWLSKNEQQTTAYKETTALGDFLEDPALEAVLYQQEEKKLEPGYFYKRQFEQGPEEVRALIEKIETDLKDANALDRLNKGQVGDEERNKIGNQFAVLNRLREQDIVQQLSDIENEVVALELNHGQRLRDYGVVQP